MSSAEQTGLTIVGAGAGFVLGGPTGALYGAQIGYSIGASTLHTTLPGQQGPRLSDLSGQVAGYGWAIPKSWGTVAHMGAMIWSSGKLETAHTETVDQGGKGAPSASQDYTTYSYRSSFAIAFHDGPVSAVRRIWANEFLIFDAGDASDYGSLTGSELTAFIATRAEGLRDEDGGIAIYLGTETQEPDPTIQIYEGAANVPAYRGLAYVVFTDLQLERFGNREPTVRIEYVNVSDDVNAGSSEVRTTDYSTYNEGDGSNNLYTYIEDDGTGHLMIGDWSAPTYASSGIKYYKTFPSGGISYIKTLSVESPGTINYGLFNRPGADLCAQMPLFIYMSPTRQEWLWVEPEGDLANPGDAFYYVYTDNKAHDGGSFGYFMYHVGGIVSGTIAQKFGSKTVRIIKYEKSVALSLTLEPYTYMDIEELDVTSSNTNDYHGFAIGPTKLWMVFDSELEEWDHDGNLLNTYSFTADEPIVYAGTNDHPYVDPDKENVVWFLNDNHLHKWVDGVYEYAADLSYWSNFALTKDVYVIRNNLLFAANRATPKFGVFTLNDIEEGAEPLDNIITELSEDSGLSTSDIDVTALSGINVRGFTKSKQGANAASIEELRKIYQFSSYEDENKIIYKLRGGSVDKVIDSDDLGAGVDAPTQEILPFKNFDDQNLPRKVTLKYFDPALDYEITAQSSIRTDLYDTQQEITVEAPMVLTADEARQAVEKIHHSLWRSRLTYPGFNLPLKYLDIVPTDLLSISLGGHQHTVRATVANIDRVVRVEGAAEQSLDFTSTVSGFVPDRPYRGASYPGATEAYYIDCPPLRNRDGDNRFYAAAHGYFPDWKGAIFYVRDKAGAYGKIGATVNAVTAGATIDVLPDSDPHVFDNSSTLTVSMRNGQLASTTKAALFDSETENAALVGVNGRWEVIQFQTATDNGDGTYTLSGFLRGRRGTEWAMNQHAQNDLFILIEESTFVRLDLPDIGVQYTVVAVSIGQALRQGSTSAFTNNAIATKPFSPVHLRKEPNGDGTYYIHWIRRSRTYGAWKDKYDVPLTERGENYRVSTYYNGLFVESNDVEGTNLMYWDQPSEELVTNPNVLALLHFDGDFTDLSGKTWDDSAGATIETTTTRWGSGSMDASGGPLEAPTSTDWAFGEDDFTVEGWFYFNSYTAVNGMVDTDPGGTGFKMYVLGSTQTIRLVLGSLVGAGSTALSTGTWHHIAYSRSGTTGRLYVNGVEDDVVSDTTDYTSEGPLLIGKSYTSGMNGYVDDFRVLNYAKYTEDFTPPTEALSYLDPDGFTVRVQQISGFYGPGQASEELTI